MGFDCIETVPVGLLQVGCYLVWDASDQRGFIVDPGAEPERITEAVSAAGFSPCAILLTHGHVDHISASGPLAQAYDVPVYLHPADRDLFFSPDNCFMPWLPRAEGLPEPVHDCPACLKAVVDVLSTPGHTPGSVCFHLSAEKVLFSGDTLFRGGVGRTDFAGGNQADLERSIRGTLYQLAEETRVLPGHNDPTSIGDEKQTNPFVTG